MFKVFVDGLGYLSFAKDTNKKTVLRKHVEN